MAESERVVRGLTIEGCRTRQQQLVARLRRLKFDAAILTDRRHVYYFGGYWSSPHHAPVLLITSNGTARIVVPENASYGALAADEVRHYDSQRQATMVDDQLGASLKQIADQLKILNRVGFDSPHIRHLAQRDAFDLSREILELRRSKTEDEVDLIRCAIRGCEAAYARAAGMLEPGIREIDVFAEMQAAAIKEIGERIGEMGNDFQAGSPGGPPRSRPVEAGELMPLDVGISVRGYRCDLCRTLAVDGQPTKIQLEAAARVDDILQAVAERARVGSNCRQLYEDAFRELDGYRGWEFPHHLGHGTGLSPHEAPRLNGYSNDVLAAGDVFTLEPGLYHTELRAGVRIEQNYWLTEDGLERLSSYPTGI
jgi:Xaa-Pro aminopeptidase